MVNFFRLFFLKKNLPPKNPQIHISLNCSNFSGVSIILLGAQLQVPS
jgi:hypothetical protein